MEKAISTPLRKSLTEADIAKLFLWFHQVFGHSWPTDGNAASEKGKIRAWLDGLQGLTTNDLRRGCEQVKKLADKYPPSMGAFRSYCLPPPAAHRQARLPGPVNKTERTPEQRQFSKDCGRGLGTKGKPDKEVWKRAYRELLAINDPQGTLKLRQLHQLTRPEWVEEVRSERRA